MFYITNPINSLIPKRLDMLSCSRLSFKAWQRFKIKSNHFIGLRRSKDYYQVEWWGYMGRVIWVSFFRGSMCAERNICVRNWVRWVLQGTGTASGHPGVPWKISPRMCWVSQMAAGSKLGQPELWRHNGVGAYSIAVGGTWRRGRVALGGLDGRSWKPWGYQDSEMLAAWLIIVE